MNGDTALLCPNMIKAPAKTRSMIIGVSHQAFLSLRKLQISSKKDLLLLIFVRVMWWYLKITF